MKRFLIITLVLAVLSVVSMALPPDSEAWHRHHGHSSFFVAAGPPFYGFATGFGYTSFSRHGDFSIGFSGFWPGYYYPYYAVPVYSPAPVYNEPVYYGERYYGRYHDSRDDVRYGGRHYRSPGDEPEWVRDAEEFLEGGR